MVVDTMSYAQIREEFHLDEDEVTAKIDTYFGMENKYRKFIMTKLKPFEKYYFKPREFVSKRNNHHVIIFTTDGRTPYKEIGLQYVHYMTFKREGRDYAILGGGNKSDLLFIPHFFDRYRERFLNKPQMSNLEAMKIHFTRQEHVEMRHFGDEKHPKNLFMVTKEGVFFAEQLDCGMLMLKTCITYDMLRGSQIAEKEALIRIVLSMQGGNEEHHLNSTLKAQQVDYFGELQSRPGGNAVIPTMIVEKMSLVEAYGALMKEVLTVFSVPQQREKEAKRYEAWAKPLMEKTGRNRIAFYPERYTSITRLCFWKLFSVENGVAHEVHVTCFQCDEGRFWATRTDLQAHQELFAESVFIDYRNCYSQLKGLSLDQVIVNFFFRLESTEIRFSQSDDRLLGDCQFGKLPGYAESPFIYIYTGFTRS